MDKYVTSVLETTTNVDGALSGEGAMPWSGGVLGATRQTNAEMDVTITVDAGWCPRDNPSDLVY